MSADAARPGEEDGAAARTVGGALDAAERTLATAGVPDPRLDAEWILADVLRCGRMDLAVRGADALDDILRHGVAAAMNRVNVPPPEESPPTDD